MSGSGRIARPRGWLVCATLEHIALGVWIGGLLIIIAAVIPTVFGTLTMEPGGRLLTRIFDRYNQAVGAAIGVLLAGALLRLWWASRGLAALRPAWSEWAVLSVMIAIAATITFVLGPRTVELQNRAFAAESGPGRQAAYDAFFRTHHMVRGLYLMNLVLGIGLVAARTRREAQERGA